MLRSDAKYWLRKDWEPKVPDESEIKRQIETFKHRISGSVRLHEGLVIGKQLSKKRSAKNKF